MQYTSYSTASLDMDMDDKHFPYVLNILIRESGVAFIYNFSLFDLMFALPFLDIQWTSVIFPFEFLADRVLD